MSQYYKITSFYIILKYDFISEKAFYGSDISRTLFFSYHFYFLEVIPYAASQFKLHWHFDSVFLGKLHQLWGTPSGSIGVGVRKISTRFWGGARKILTSFEGGRKKFWRSLGGGEKNFDAKSQETEEFGRGRKNFDANLGGAKKISTDFRGGRENFFFNNFKHLMYTFQLGTEK